MKKILPLLLVTLLAAQASKAQVPPNCNAAFSFTFFNPNEVKFVPAVAGDTNTVHVWNFGDNTANSNLISPVHVYQSPGTYAVVHTIIVYNNGAIVCSNSYAGVVNIQNTSCNLVANFAWIQDSTSLTVYFQNNSTPINLSDSVRWTFGDGTSASTYHATHTYTNAMTYQVCLRIWQRVNGVVNTSCFREYCQNIPVVSHSSCNLNLSFIPHLNNNTNNNFTFDNTSNGISQGDSIRWTYSDGTSGNSYDGNHVYTSPGTYTVCLRVIKRNSNGSLSSCVREACNTIIVNSPCNVTAEFTSQTDSTSTIAYFNNTSVGISPTDSVRWNFGDGTSAGT